MRAPRSSPITTAWSVTRWSARAYTGRSLAGASSIAAAIRTSITRPIAAGSPSVGAGIGANGVLTARAGASGSATGVGALFADEQPTTSDNAITRMTIVNAQKRTLISSPTWRIPETQNEEPMWNFADRVVKAVSDMTVGTV